MGQSAGNSRLQDVNDIDLDIAEGGGKGDPSDHRGHHHRG
jgi:hypothetical protein